jgi:tRNA-intron endonuclease, archaea type
MKIQGTFIDEKIIVQRAKDVGRLFNKSHFGRPLKDNKLQLDFIEGCFLIDEDKISITKDGKKLSFDELVSIAASKNLDFDVKYIVFKDIKNRGHSVTLYDELKGVTFYDFKKEFFVCVFSENSLFNVKETINLICKVVKKDVKLWFAVVDSEGDVTYYDVSIVDFKGFNKKAKYTKNKGFLLDNSIIVFDEKLKNNLFEKEFFGKPFGSGLRLSFVEGLYLSDEKILDIVDIKEKNISRKDFIQKIRKIDPMFDERFKVYCDLKKRGLITKTGFKFGTDFRCYTRSPDEIHAEYLVHMVDEKFKSAWSEMSRAIRLAHSVNKEIIFACVEKDKIEYIKFGRLKP